MCICLCGCHVMCVSQCMQRQPEQLKHCVADASLFAIAVHFTARRDAHLCESVRASECACDRVLHACCPRGVRGAGCGGTREFRRRQARPQHSNGANRRVACHFSSRPVRRQPCVTLPILHSPSCVHACNRGAHVLKLERAICAEVAPRCLTCDDGCILMMWHIPR